MIHVHPKYQKTTEFIFDDTDPFADTPKKLDVRAFFKEEFLNSNAVTFSRIANIYRKLYGTPARNYMRNTFPRWKAGEVELSEQTMSRLLLIMPKVLSSEKRFYMLSSEVNYYLNTMQYYHQHKSIDKSISGINTLFVNYYQKIIRFDINRLSWFTSKGIFSEADVESFLSVCFCAIRQQLALNCRQVFNDLRLIKNKLEKYNIAGIDGTYYIQFLDMYVNLSEIKTTNLDAKQFENIEPDFSGPFKAYQELYFLDEVRKMDRCKKEGERNAYIKANDLELLFGLHQKNIRNNHQAKISSSVSGEGGTLYIELNNIPVTTIIGAFSVPSLKILTLLFFECIFLYLFFKLNTLGDNVLGFYGGLIIIPLLCFELFRLKNSITRYLSHG